MDFNLDPAKQVIVNRFLDYVDRELVPLEAEFLESGFAALPAPAADQHASPIRSRDEPQIPRTASPKLLQGSMRSTAG